MSNEREPLLPSTSPDVSEDTGTQGRRGPWPYLRCLVLITSIAALAISLSGCTTSSVIARELHILSLSYDAGSLSSSPQLASRNSLSAVFTDRLKDKSNIKEIRIGYFGLCAVSNSSSFFCSPRPLDIAESLRASGQTDPLNLLWLGNRLRTEAVSSALVFLSAAILFTAFVCGLISSNSAKTKGPASSTLFSIFLNRPLSVTAFAIALFFATSSAFTAALWQNLTGTTSSLLVKNLTFGAVACYVGPATVVLGWVSFSLACCTLISLLNPFRRDDTAAE